MIDSPFWSWALVVMFFFMLIVYFYIIVYSKSSKRLRKRLYELQKQQGMVNPEIEDVQYRHLPEPPKNSA